MYVQNLICSISVKKRECVCYRRREVFWRLDPFLEAILPVGTEYRRMIDHNAIACTYVHDSVAM